MLRRVIPSRPMGTFIGPRNIRKREDKQPSARQLAFKSMSRLEDYLKSGRFDEAIQAITNTTEHGIFGRSETKMKWYTTELGLRFPMKPSEGELAKKVRPLPKLATVRPEVWNLVIKRLGEKGMWKEAFKLYRTMVRRRVQPSQETYTSLLDACSKRMKVLQESATTPSTLAPASNSIYMTALRLYRSMEQSPSVKINRIHVNSLLQCVSRARDWQMLFKMYRQMNHVGSDMRRRARVDLPAFIKQTRRVRKLKEKEAAAQGILDDKDAEEWVKHRLREYLNKKDETAETDQDSDVELETVEETSDHNAHSLLQKIQRVRPDVITYSILLSACANRGGDAAFDDAMALWDDLKKDIQASQELTLKQREAFLSNSSKPGAKQGPKKSRVHFMDLSEEEYAEWKEHEDLMKELDEQFPLISVDAELVNSMLLVCKNAQSRKNQERAFEIVHSEFGNTFDWSLFEKYYRECVDPKIKHAVSSRIRAIRDLPVHESLVAYPTPVLANPKTLAIIMHIMHKQCGVPSQVVRSFYRFMVEPTGPEYRFYKTIDPDNSLRSFYLQLMVDCKEYDDAFKAFDRMCKRIKKASQSKHHGDLPRFMTMPPSTYQMVMKACCEKGDDVLADTYWDQAQEAADRRLLYSFKGVHDTSAPVFYPTPLTAIYWLRAKMAKKENAEEALQFVRRHMELAENADGWRKSFAASLLNFHGFWSSAVRACDTLIKLKEKYSEEREALMKERIQYLTRHKELSHRPKFTEPKSEEQDIKLPTATLVSSKTPGWLKEEIKKVLLEKE